MVTSGPSCDDYINTDNMLSYLYAWLRHRRCQQSLRKGPAHLCHKYGKNKFDPAEGHEKNVRSVGKIVKNHLISKPCKGFACSSIIDFKWSPSKPFLGDSQERHASGTFTNVRPRRLVFTIYSWNKNMSWKVCNPADFVSQTRLPPWRSIAQIGFGTLCLGQMPTANPSVPAPTSLRARPRGLEWLDIWFSKIRWCQDVVLDQNSITTLVCEPNI